MKNLWPIFALFLFSSTLFAQNTPLTKIDSMLVNIDKSTFTTGILYERVTPLAGLNYFKDSLNIANTAYFEQALSELYRASNTQKFIAVEQYRANYTPTNNHNTVAIGIINANFNELNYSENNTNSALKIVNNAFVKKQNTLAPFIEKNVLIISPLKQYLKGNAINYTFSNALLLQDTNKTIASISANFDTLEDYTIYNNGAFTNTDIPYTV